jgi:Abnormal spindle-like microcephaly-assoc'd, ASPM-SPD-2-Hydin/Flagellar-associated PapD-like
MHLGARLAAVVLLVTVSGASGCRPDGGGGGTVEVDGVIAVGSRDVGFGLVALGQFRDERVTFKNNSRISVTVSRLSSTMPSVTVLSSEGFTLAPAQERSVVLRFAPAVEGEVTGQLVAATDIRGEGQLQRVQLRGMGVRSYVDVQPKVLDFGRVELDTVKVLSVEAHNPTEVNTFFSLVLGGNDPDEFSAPETVHEVRVGPGETLQVPIAFRPLRLGLAQATATILRCPTCSPEVVSLRGEGGAGMLAILPTRLDYGRVALGARAEQRITLRNAGNADVTFLRAWTEGGAASYSVVNAPPQASLRQGQSVDITVAFQPSEPSLHQGLLRLEVQEGSAPVRRYTVSLTGVGGTSCITLIPRTLDFGTVAEGMSLNREVYAFNSCKEDVTLTDVIVRTTQGGFFSLATTAAPVVIPKGDKVPVLVAFTPEAGSARSEGQLTAIIRQGNTTGADVVALRGSSRVFAPCQYRVDPTGLPFGRVQVGSTVALGVALTNVGTDDCFVSRVQLTSDSDPSFSTDALQGGALAPGAKKVFSVRFSPAGMGSASGRLQGEVNHPTHGLFTVPLSGEGVQACLTLEPGTVDFGTVKRSCGEREREVMARNRCNVPVTISSAVFDVATSDELGADDEPDLPLTLIPGEEQAFTLTYEPTDEGEDTAAFRVTSLEQGTLTVGLRGNGLDTPIQSDRFVQVMLDQVDVLFVIDNSLTMMEEQQSLGQNFAAFMSAALSGGIDYHIGVTTTGINRSSEDPPLVCAGGVGGGEAGRLFPADNSSPRIITPSTPNAAAVFAYNTTVGNCPQVERGFDAAYRALSPPLVDSVDDPRTSLANDGNAGFLRPDARLAIVFVSDEDDQSPTCSPSRPSSGPPCSPPAPPRPPPVPATSPWRRPPAAAWRASAPRTGPAR